MKLPQDIKGEIQKFKDFFDIKNVDGLKLRLQAHCRTADFEDSIAMRIADPLWMLGRQWQFGEWQGEDNGSPVEAKVYYAMEETRELKLVQDEQTVSVNVSQSGGVPLEAAVELLHYGPENWDWRHRIRVGQQMEIFLRETADQVVLQGELLALRQSFPVLMPPPEELDEIDKKTKRFLQFMQGRALDGRALWQAMTNGDLTSAPLQAAFAKLRTWHQALFLDGPEHTSAWQGRQLRYQFEVQTRSSHEGNVKLFAPDYQNGDLDWYSFDKAQVTLSPFSGEVLAESFIPLSLRFAGMPTARLYAFEENQTDFGDLQLDTQDLSRLMLIEFAMAYSNDWFVLPLELPIGNLCWIREIRVRDVFGVETLIENNANTGPVLDSDNPLKIWDVFKIRAAGDLPATLDPKDHFIYLAPAIPFRQESEALEEVHFVRDGYANLVWGIEQRVRNGLGKGVSGFDAQLEEKRLREEASESTGMGQRPHPTYHLANTVPDNWIPYLPQPFGNSEQIYLKKAQIIRNEEQGVPELIASRSQLLQELEALREERIPRAGVKVQLNRQRVRWTDGQTFIWLGRKVTTGKGEGSSGLQFDILRED